MNDSLRTELDRQRTALTTLCQKYGVARLDLFGSGTTADWRPGESDLDFVVAFHAQPGASLADRYLGFAEASRPSLGDAWTSSRSARFATPISARPSRRPGRPCMAGNPRKLLYDVASAAAAMAPSPGGAEAQIGASHGIGG